MNVKKKSVKRNVIIGVVFVFVLILTLFGYFLYTDLKQEDILREEVSTLTKKDITKDRYDSNIKTRGDYAVVEKAIKSYLDEYATTCQSVLKIMENKKLINMLSAENYQKDGPDFNTSKKYLSDTKTELNKDLDRLTAMTSSEEIMKNIEDKHLDTYYNDLYKELMLNGIAEKDFESAKGYLETASKRVNNLLNVEEAVINLLITNKGKWKIQDDKIVFDEVNTLNQYNELINKVAQ